MKTMLKITMMLMLAAMTTTLSAQPQQRGPQKDGQRPSRKEMVQMRTDKMAKALDLTEAQKQKVYNLNMDEVKSRPERKEGEQVDRETRKAEMQKRREAYNAKLKKILTDEQFDKWEKRQAEMQKRGHRGPQSMSDQSRKDFNPQNRSSFSQNERRKAPVIINNYYCCDCKCGKAHKQGQKAKRTGMK